MTAKFCKDCVHYEAWAFMAVHNVCHAPCASVSMVTGELLEIDPKEFEPKPRLCERWRSAGGPCGPDGKLFELKQ